MSPLSECLYEYSSGVVCSGVLGLYWCRNVDHDPICVSRVLFCAWRTSAELQLSVGSGTLSVAGLMLAELREVGVASVIGTGSAFSWLYSMFSMDQHYFDLHFNFGL